jgi:acetylornithine deacetylase
MMQTQEILDHLIGFDTVSSRPNIELMGWVRDLLARHGVASVLIPDASGGKANLYATIGPQDRPGVLLSGHTDVVPVDGQHWTKPPFALTVADGRCAAPIAADSAQARKPFMSVAPRP